MSGVGVASLDTNGRRHSRQRSSSTSSNGSFGRGAEPGTDEGNSDDRAEVHTQVNGMEDDLDEGVVLQRDKRTAVPAARARSLSVEAAPARTPGVGVLLPTACGVGGVLTSTGKSGGIELDFDNDTHVKSKNARKNAKQNGDNKPLPSIQPGGADASKSTDPKFSGISAATEEPRATTALNPVTLGSGETQTKATVRSVTTKQKRLRGDSLAEEYEIEVRISESTSTAARLPRKHLEQRRGLPIFAHKAAIIRAVKEHQTVVVVGETGSGKSTQIPQFLYEGGLCGGGPGWTGIEQRGPGKKRPRNSITSERGQDKRVARRGGVIACTQPRRVAAVTVSRRVAAEVGSELGHVVGYSVRFDDCTSQSTRIKYMTDGVLLREAMSDPLLSAYTAIVLDEAHERSLDTDILFGLVRRLQPKRPDLKVVVMSATLDVDLFRRFFRDSVSLHVPGRTHPVEVMYAAEAQDDYVDACLITCLQIHEEAQGDGDVLVFLPGQDDIESLGQLLREHLANLRAEKSREVAAAGLGEFHVGGGGNCAGESEVGLMRDFLVCPVFAALPQEQQLEAFEPAPKGTRKFVLATNIAETSITINGIRYVVDSGKVKVRSFQPSTGMEFLRSKNVSKAQATQRAGRAGREAPGVCFRLYRENEYLQLDASPTPEILRVNLAQVVLQLKVMGIQDPSTFEYVTSPSPAAVLKALKTLVMLGALDKAGKITPDGQKMAALPLDPAFAHLLVRSTEPRFACAKEVLTTVACLSAENLFFYPPKEDAKLAANEAHRAFAAYEGDLPTLLNVYDGFLKEKKDPNWCRRNFINRRSVARAVDVREQLAKILRDRLKMDPEESCGAERVQYLRCLVAGLFTNVAMRQPTASGGGRGCYRTIVGGREALIHPSSSLWRRNPPAKCVVFTELLSTTKEFIKTVTAVDAAWLSELVPRFFRPVGAGSTRAPRTT